MNIDDLVRLAAEALKMPESMVRQSAEARSKTAGRTVEVILGEWAGVDPAAEAPPRAETPAPPPPAEAPAAPPGVAEAPAAAPAAPAAAAGPGIDAADLLTRAAAAQGLPEAMTKRSAAARAKAEGQTVEQVLAEWAGVELSAAPAPEAPAAPTAPPESPPPPAPAAEAPAAPVDAPDLLAKAAAAQGLPEAMTKRSAAARAKAEGKTPEQVLAEWAGVEAPAATEAPAAAAAPAAVAPVATPAEAPAAAQIEVIAEESEEVPTETPRVRELVTPTGALPRWLAALFVAVPLFAVTYASFLPNGPNCGDAGSLGVDPVTGIAVNCDGSEFGQDEVDFFAIGAQVFGVRCAACHGPSGGGVASFPPFIDGALLATFPDGSCDQHVEWVTLGSAGWPDATYGANNKPVGGLGVMMPPFGTQLSEQELHSVVAYERVQFGGLPLDGVLTDCGLVEESAG
jgi:mono/diheme cytochrome c family protein